ncbi:MAG: hypothetical protein ABI220_02380 [Candidatus Saccharimonadales bacterium]
MTSQLNSQLRADITADSRRIDPMDAILSHDASVYSSVLGDLAMEGVLAATEVLESTEELSLADERGVYRSGCDNYLEIVYRDQANGSEGTQFSADWDEAQSFFARALEHAEQSDGQNPQHLWEIRVKYLDLRAMQAHVNARDSQTVLRGTEAGKNGWALAEHQMRGVLTDSLPLMRSMAKFASGTDKLASDARGKLYEVLMVAYARMQTYEDQTFDTTFVRSALGREDSPLNDHVEPRRAFDMVIESPGMPTRLIQLKNHDSKIDYAYPIEKVQDVNFRHTRSHLPQYISDYGLLLQNSADPKVKPYIDRAAKELDEAFGKGLRL